MELHFIVVERGLKRYQICEYVRDCTVKPSLVPLLLLGTPTQQQSEIVRKLQPTSPEGCNEILRGIYGKSEFRSLPDIYVFIYACWRCLTRNDCLAAFNV